MAYLVVENFLGGLDTRRHVLASKAGTLARLNNAHITRGGEIEKRKAFTLFAQLPANTFGLEAAGGTLWSFGSIPAPTMPQGVTYQRLTHPDGLAMTELVTGCAYAGKPFVIAKFTDGNSYAFYDGVIVNDFVNGVARASMQNIAGFTAHIASLFPVAGFTAQVSGNGILISGPEGKPYKVVIATDGDITATQTHIQDAVEPIDEVQAVGSFTIYQGSETPSTVSKPLRYGNYAAMPGITKMYVDGVDILGLSPGSSILWNSADGQGWGDQGQRMVITLAHFVNLNSPQSGFTARWEASSGWSGPDYGGIWIMADPQRGSKPNGDLVQLEFEAQPNFGSMSEFISVSSIAKSPYYTEPHNYWIATFGTLSGGAFTGITSITVDGLEIMGKPEGEEGIAWTTSHSNTASNVAEQINIFSSDPEYVASVQEGAKVKLTAEPGLGASANGRFISVSTSGSAGVQSVLQMSGGKDPIGGVAQQVSIAFGGTFTPGSKVTLTLIREDSPDFPVHVGATGVGNSKPVQVITYKSKIHLLSEQYLFSSALDNPRVWDDTAIGTSVIDMSNNVEGAEQLTAATPYQGKLSIFGRRSCQVWGIDVDPSKNAQLQVVPNSGAVSTNSVISYGEIDSFYLTDSGIRSLRSRDSSTNAFSSDIGLPIDTMIVDEIRTNPVAAAKSSSAIEPLDNRYMLAIGNKIYVLSQFAGSGLSAWSTYEPGFNVDKMIVVGGRLYVRSGNNVYLYGGADNNTYDSSPVEVILPYLDGGKPAHNKTALGIDLTIDGTWTVELGMDPFAQNSRDVIATVSTSTFSLGRILANGRGTHFGLKLTNNTNAYARIANVFIHYELNEAD